MPGVDEVAQPLSRERVYLVVVSGHGSRNEKPRSVAGLGVVKIRDGRSLVAAAHDAFLRSLRISAHRSTKSEAFCHAFSGPLHHVHEMCGGLRLNQRFLHNHVESQGAAHMGVL